jgi:hypothetical protein
MAKGERENRMKTFKIAYRLFRLCGNTRVLSFCKAVLLANGKRERLYPPQ